MGNGNRAGSPSNTFCSATGPPVEVPMATRLKLRRARLAGARATSLGADMSLPGTSSLALMASRADAGGASLTGLPGGTAAAGCAPERNRSEEHTSELQTRENL